LAKVDRKEFRSSGVQEFEELQELRRRVGTPPF
jgi:hypothetical protein